MCYLAPGSVKEGKGEQESDSFFQGEPLTSLYFNIFFFFFSIKLHTAANHIEVDGIRTATSFFRFCLFIAFPPSWSVALRSRVSVPDSSKIMCCVFHGWKVSAANAKFTVNKHSLCIFNEKKNPETSSFQFLTLHFIHSLSFKRKLMWPALTCFHLHQNKTQNNFSAC